MGNWFLANDVRYMKKLTGQVSAFEYKTRKAWSHGDLNSGNVLYDKKSSTLSFIDFAEAEYKFIYRDIFAPLQIELDICKQIYELYTKLHDRSKYPMLGLKNENLQEIMKYRMIVVVLRRFIKASDDLRLNPQNERSAKNNLEKIQFMRDAIQNLQIIEKKFQK